MARDAFHQAVRHALEKEGWVITHDPLKLEFETVKTLVDLGAERLIAATRDNERIAVEIKSFIGTSEINEFHTALGQFLNYQMLLERLESDRRLFLAIPEDAYESFFVTDFALSVVQKYGLRLLVYNPLEEVIVTWK
jgi:hypothetical protein